MNLNIKTHFDKIPGKIMSKLAGASTETGIPLSKIKALYYGNRKNINAIEASKILDFLNSHMKNELEELKIEDLFQK